MMKSGRIRRDTIFHVALLLIVSWLLYSQGIRPAAGNARGDFANYYTSAKLVAKGAPLQKAYELPWFQMQIDRLGIKHQIGSFIPFPPPTGLVLLSLARLQPAAARNTWTAIQLGLLILLILLLHRLTGLPWLLTAVVVFSSGYALINEIRFGQLYLLLTASIVAALLAYRRGHQAAAGILLGVLIPVKYLGVLFVLYFAWKRQWRLVSAAVITASAGVLLALWLGGAEPFCIFFTRVLPRHLQGQIQDPYAIAFQSWNSLLRRMLAANPLLNPSPPLHAPVLFIFSKNLVFWAFLTLAIFVLRWRRFDVAEHGFFFDIGIILLFSLLLAPASASYHFLLLTISLAVFLTILPAQKRPAATWSLLLLFILLNLPLQQRLQHWAHGWSTPLAYPRLGLLLLFAALVLFFFHRRIQFPKNKFIAGRYAVAAAFLVLAGSASTAWRQHSRPSDGARPISLPLPTLAGRAPLILKHLHRGGRDAAFTYADPQQGRYRIFSLQRGAWRDTTHRNFYFPGLAANDRALLAQTFRAGQAEIWFSPAPDQPLRPLAPGEHPTWCGNDSRFAYILRNSLFFAKFSRHGLAGHKLRQAHPAGARLYDPCGSGDGRQLAYCLNLAHPAVADSAFQIRSIDLQTGIETVLLATPEPLQQPAWSADARTLLFAWRQNGNLDIWALDLPSRRLQRLTRHPAQDSAPVWDQTGRRILFLSDRDRGLECSAVFSLPLPVRNKAAASKAGQTRRSE